MMDKLDELDELSKHRVRFWIRSGAAVLGSFLLMDTWAQAIGLWLIIEAALDVIEEHGGLS